MCRADRRFTAGSVRERLVFLAVNLHGLSAPEAASVIEKHSLPDGSIAASAALSEIRRREHANSNGQSGKHCFIRCEALEVLRALLSNRAGETPRW